ncbi:MAG: winged helix-turn-helix domain-containing protein [Patescibacteria group bacterium]
MPYTTIGYIHLDIIMTIKVTTSWNHSLETEADRIVQASANTYNRFYLKFGFIVLPYRIANHPEAVYLPDLNYPKIPGYIKKVSQLEPKTIPVTNQKNLLEPIKKALSKVGHQPNEAMIKNIMQSWQLKEKKFWPTLQDCLPQLKNKSLQVIIHPTSFGTGCSFNPVIWSKKTLLVKLYLRLDQDISQISEAIISALLWPIFEKDGYSWQEKEAVVDFFLTHTRLNRLLPNFKPTLATTRKKELAKLVQESQKYLRQLGISTGEVFSLANDRVLIEGKKLLQGITKKEKSLLCLLVKNKNRLCSFDQISEAIWLDDSFDKFSDWAVTKLVQRLRTKLQENGFSPNLIQTQRGQGYLLKD